MIDISMIGLYMGRHDIGQRWLYTKHAKRLKRDMCQACQSL